MSEIKEIVAVSPAPEGYVAVWIWDENDWDEEPVVATVIEREWLGNGEYLDSAWFAVLDQDGKLTSCNERDPHWVGRAADAGQEVPRLARLLTRAGKL